jgi:hypothetical protein
MIDKLKLVLVTIIGTVFAYLIIDYFIVQVSFGQYFLIELLITVMHFMYQMAKSQIVNT